MLPTDIIFTSEGDTMESGVDLNMLFGKITKLEKLVRRNQELLCELLNRDGIEGYIDNEDVTFKVVLEPKKTGKTVFYTDEVPVKLKERNKELTLFDVSDLPI